MRSAFGVEHGEIFKGVPKGMSRLRLKRTDIEGFSQITARRRKKDLGVLLIHHAPGQPQHGKIAAVEVSPRHQRKGLATAMYQHAERTGITPVHNQIRTKEGDAWAQSVGGAIPKRRYPRALDNPPPTSG
jgi:GNAT superfamily N-acetyltransferase